MEDEKELKDSDGGSISKEMENVLSRHFDKFAKTIEKNLTENMLNFYNNIKEKEKESKEPGQGKESESDKEIDTLVDF